MSVTKDGDTGRWMSQIRVADWTGKTIHKKKRGFATKKEALQWERDFISQSTGSLGMTFGDFISLYVKDMEHHLKPSTVASKKWLIDLNVTPFFKKIPLNEIKPTHVRQWQNSLTSYRDENGKPYAQTYPYSRRPLQLFAGVYVPLLRTAKGRPALSLYQELSVSRNGVWLQGFGREADTGA